MMAKRTTAVLLALALITAMVSVGCQPQEQPPEGEEEIGSVSVMGVWGGTEVENFNSVVDGWEEETGGTMEFEGTRDLSAVLRARVSGQNPPDLAILPNPALAQEFAEAGNLQPLDDALADSNLEENYSEAWLQQVQANGQLYGLVIKAAPKSTVWYNPATFEERNYEIPESWDALIDLSEQMVDDGTAPWSIGAEAAAASGWPASDWIQEILLSESGPEVYDQWVAHEIPWTDARIKSAWERFGEVVHTDGFVLGGPDRIVSTNFEDGSYAPYQDPPQANMYFLGAFAQGFIAAQFEDLQPEEDYNFFKFPPVNPQYEGAVTGSADVIVMFNDTPSARSLLAYLAEGDSWVPWAEAGGFLTPNESFDASAFPDPLAARAAEQLVESQIFRVDADDLMPAEVQNAYWSGLLEYIQDEDRLDAILQDIERVASEAYQQEQEQQSEEETPAQ